MLKNSMKTSDIIWNLVVAIYVVYGFSLVDCKRQKPHRNEIERVINDTHSVIWKCSECPPGYGLSAECGTSVPFSVQIECKFCMEGVSYSSAHDYSSCKSCRTCSAHEVISGHCTASEDTIQCLQRCHKGFYWEKSTNSCHPCSRCCSKNLKYHEEQCENSDYPLTHQCRQTNIECENPTIASNHDKKQARQIGGQQRTLSSLMIIAIVFSLLTITTLVIIALFVMSRLYGWQGTKTKLKNCFRCKYFATSITGNTFYFHNDVFDEIDVESSISWGEIEVHLEEAEDNKGHLKSVPPGTNFKRPGLLRLFSEPAQPLESKSKPEKIITRSRSHPGCLKDLHKEPAANKPVTSKKCAIDRKTKKFDKKVYISVASADPELPDQGPNAENTATTEPEQPLNFTGAEREERPKTLGPPIPAGKDQSTSTSGLHDPSTCINQVPEYFQSSLLKKKMKDIPIKFYSKICNSLDIFRDLFWDDYRLLGEKIGLSRDEVLLLGQRKNTTDLMMQKFDSQKNSCIGKLRRILEEMERGDVLTIINEWIVHEWSRLNSSSALNV